MKNIRTLLFLSVLTFITEFFLIIVNYKNLILIKKYKTLKTDFKYQTIKIYTKYNNKELSKIFSNLKSIKFNNKPRIQIVKHQNKAMVYINPSLQKNKQTMLYQFFVPVGHLYWIENKFNNKTKSIYCITNTCSYLTQLLPNYKFIEIKNKQNLLNKLKNNEAIPALIDINMLTPEFKLLTYNNNYFLDNKNNKGAIIIYWNIYSTNKKYNKFAIAIKNITLNNPAFKINSIFDTNNISTVIQTGVTAISRGLAYKIEALHDYTYPAHLIKNLLLNADITHTSNEVSFVPGCKPTNGMRFCSSPNYFKLLKYIDLDIVELTGNHNNDYGSKWNTWTIKNFYMKNNIKYFGGGLNDKDASKILFKTVKNTKLAFLGYNYYDTIYKNYNALATKKHAGANSFSLKKLKHDIKIAKQKANIVIVDVQFQECYAYPKTNTIYPICYKPLKQPDQKYVFRKIIDLGADIVVGTQAHQPQTYEIYKNKLIFYGLGNIFFDQINWIGTRQALVIKHYFYNGKHIQTKIIPIIQEENMQEKIASPTEAKLLLKLLKKARPR